MRSEFVRASKLYDVENRTPIAHPAHQATDDDVRQALKDWEEIRAGDDTVKDGIQRLLAYERFRCVIRLHFLPPRHPTQPEIKPISNPNSSISNSINSNSAIVISTSVDFHVNKELGRFAYCDNPLQPRIGLLSSNPENSTRNGGGER